MCQFETPVFIYYSHITVFILTLLTGFIILFKDIKHPINRNAFYFILIIALWTIDDLVQWTAHSVSLNMFSAEISVMADLIFLFFLYFVYHFTCTEISIKKKWLLAIPYILLLFLAFTKYNIQVFNISDCNYAHTKFMNGYLYLFEFLYIGWASYLLIKYYRNPINSSQARSQIKVLLPAIWFFIIWIIIYEEISRISFLSNNYIDVTPQFIIGNLFFVSLIAFSIIKKDLFEFCSVPLNWLVVFVWLLIFVGMLLFSMNIGSSIISGIAYIILMIIFLKM
ncbi:MAG TPA: histidine kinase N-terminal 7TM domain-containing protein [Candidatus Moranbacteria bacterium]|nr:histidine kinase N-terminal 7TM domain-containing protein [Candidatus Moranbacteria bacterium]